MKRIAFILLIVFGICSIDGVAQRRINPVTPNSNAVPAKDRKNEPVKKKQDDKKNLAEFRDAQGNVVLVDTISGQEYVDSTAIAEKSKLKFPRWHEVTVGLNIWDPLMRIMGQKYGGVSVWGELSIHNRFKPIIEIGFGTADYSPEDGNYTYKSSFAPYFKIGMNYNFMFKSTPDYQFYAGLRYGFSSFSYEITDVRPNSDYWQENTVFNIPAQNSSAGFGEIVLGMKVHILKNISLGWALNYHMILHESKNTPYGEPWYIPGFGTRTSAIGGNFSIMYTLPLGKKSKPEVPAGTTATDTEVQPVE